MFSCLLIESHHTQYAVRLDCVRSVFLLPQLSAAPEGAPSYVVGVVNFHGDCVPVINLSKRLGHQAQPYDVNNTILLLEVNGKSVGLVVAGIRDLVEVAEGMVLPPMKFDGAELGDISKCIAGQINFEDDMTMLLDASVLTDFSSVDDLAAHGTDNDLNTFLQTLSEGNQTLLKKRMHNLGEVAPIQDLTLEYFVIVSVGEHLFAIERNKVIEFARIDELTVIPCCPPSILGCMSLRGEILTLINMTYLLNKSAEQVFEEMVVVEDKGQRLALAVNKVVNFIPVPAEQVSLFGVDVGVEPQYCKAILHVENETAGLINLDLIFSQKLLEVNELV